jgi:RTX calcium-binding nonapeptide repeat (4 copies)
MRGRTIFFAVVAVLSLLSATAVAGGHRVVQGTKGGDELNAGGGADRVFARSGDDQVDGGTGNDKIRGGTGDDALFGGDGKDRLRGGQDNDFLDGGDGDDYLNGGGDGRDKDKIVCGDGYDVVVLGRNDVVLVEVDASEESGESEEDDGCEKVRKPGGDREACASTGCEQEPCASTNGGCQEPRTCASRVAPGCYPTEPVCAATYDGCEDPVVKEPEPDEPVEEPLPDES